MKRQNLNFVLVLSVILIATIGTVSALDTYISNQYSIFNGRIRVMNFFI
jgi:hypothetical protein